MRIRTLALAVGCMVVATLAATACSVVGNGKVDKVEPQFGLDETLPPTTTVAPTTTQLETTTTGFESSTTAVPTEPVRLYYIASGQLVFVATPLPAGAALSQISAALQAGPDTLGDLGAGLRSAVPDQPEIRATDNNAGVAVVELPEGFFDSIPVADQRLAVAQIVLTLTDSRGIGQVQFDVAVPRPSGALAPAGQPLSRNDFLSLVEGATVSSTTVAASTTTAP